MWYNLERIVIEFQGKEDSILFKCEVKTEERKRKVYELVKTLFKEKFASQ